MQSNFTKSTGTIYQDYPVKLTNKQIALYFTEGPRNFEQARQVINTLSGMKYTTSSFKKMIHNKDEESVAHPLLRLYVALRARYKNFYDEVLLNCPEQYTFRREHLLKRFNEDLSFASFVSEINELIDTNYTPQNKSNYLKKDKESLANPVFHFYYTVTQYGRKDPMSKKEAREILNEKGISMENLKEELEKYLRTPLSDQEVTSFLQDTSENYENPEQPPVAVQLYLAMVQEDRIICV